MVHDEKYDLFLQKMKEAEKQYGKNFNKNLSIDSGISKGYISQILKGKKRAIFEYQIKIAKFCKFDLQTMHQKDIDKEILRHIDVIKKFKNKSLVCKINEKLVELENLDEIAFAEVIVEIDKKLKRIENYNPGEPEVEYGQK